MIKMMGFWQSLPFFAIPSAVAGFGIYFVMQRLYQNGVDNFVNFYVSMVAFKTESRHLNRTTLADRFRLKKWLIRIDIFAPPEFLVPAVDPRLDQGIGIIDLLISRSVEGNLN